MGFICRVMDIDINRQIDGEIDCVFRVNISLGPSIWRLISRTLSHFCFFLWPSGCVPLPQVHGVCSSIDFVCYFPRLD